MKALGKVSRKKITILLDFVQNTTTPSPLPLIWTSCATFFNTNVPKKLSKDLHLPPHPKIDPIYTVCVKWTKIWAGPSPLHLDKIQKNSYFFREAVPNSIHLDMNKLLAQHIIKLIKLFVTL